ncbi:signal transduction protein [Brasilonema octagenarum UFV-E1]|nr:signal transduction protein [Brasilonema octagenarum UFV-E1]
MNPYYLAVECTGFAFSTTLKDSNFTRKNGFLSFDHAIEYGSNQLEDKQENKKFICALDIPIAYYFWRFKLCRERLEPANLKTLTNNSKNLLKDIYVSLGLVERKSDAKRRANQDLVNPEKSNFNQPDKEEIVKKFVNDEFFTQVLQQKNSSKSKGKRLVIVGDPGGGKTTFLQKIADWVIEQEEGLPIWISLADVKNNSVEEQGFNDPGWLYRYLSQKWLTDAFQAPQKTSETLQDLFYEEVIESGQLWLMLDGADEMAVSYSLKKIGEQLDKTWTDKITVVLSCRLNLWELQKDFLIKENKKDGKNFDVYRTLDFHYPEQVHQFIKNWFGEDNPDGKKLQDKLKEDSRERLRDLVTNPLRLTLLCHIWSENSQRLPNTKADFYQFLVDNYNQLKKDVYSKFQIPEGIRKELNPKLGELARHAIDDVNCRFRLRESFIKKYLHHDPNDEKSSLFLWALKLGWLLDIGYPTEGENNSYEKVYAFFHPSFQEYFAATVDKTYDFFLPSEHKNRPVKDESYRIFEPQWREVILLWLGRIDVDNKQKEDFIQRLVNFEDGCGKFYQYRAYFLAAAGIAEIIQCDEQLVDKIVNQIVTWEFGDFDSKKRDWVKFPNDFANEASRTLQQTQRTKAIDALVQLLSNNDLDDSTRRQAVESLGKIGTGNQKAIDALVQLLSNNDLYDYIRWQAAESLGKIGTGNQKAINDLYDYIRWQAAESLGKIGTGNQKAIDALVQLLSKNDLYDSTRRQAAESLGKIDPGNQKAIDALVQLLSKNDLHDFTRWQAAESLEKINPGNQKAIDTLVQLLSKNDLHDSTLRQAAESLGKIGTDNQKAIDALVQLLSKNDLDYYIRWQAAESLEKIDPGNQKAIDALVQLLYNNHFHYSALQQAAKSLEKIDPGNQKTIDALVQLLSNNDLDYYTLRQAAESLGKIDTGNQKAIDALVQLLSNNDLDNDTLRQAAESLGKIDTGNQKAIDALVQLLSNNDLDDDTRWRAAESLEKIDTGNQKAIDALVQLLSNNDLDNDTRRLAAYSLGEIGPGNQKAINALVQLLSNNDLDDSTRWQAAQSLGEIGTGNQKAIDALVQLLSKNDLNYYARWRAAESLGKIDPGNQKAIDALVQLLSNNDLNYYARWQAAQSLEKIDPGNKSALDVVAASKGYFNNSQEFSNEYFFDVIWHCSEKILYPEFYQAWHRDSRTNPITQILKSLKRGLTKLRMYVAKSI